MPATALQSRHMAPLVEPVKASDKERTHFGEFLRLDGVWNGQQVLPPGSVAVGVCMSAMGQRQTYPTA
jgi:hypothetical protein